MGENYIDQLLASGQPAENLAEIVGTSAPKELSPLAKQLLANWQGLGENVGIGSAGTERAEIGGRPLAEVAEDFARRLSQQGVTDISQAKFAPGAQAAWTPEGKGNVSLVATQDGRLVPVWGSSSDASKARQVALALGSAWLAPGLAGALGGGFAGSAGAGAILGAGRAAITGGDVLKGALTGGLTGGVGYGVSSIVDPFAADIGRSVGDVAGKTVGEAARGAVSGAARSGVGAAFTGGDIGEALLSGAVGGGMNAATADVLSGLPKEVRGPVTAAVSAGLLGKDPTQAAIMSYAGSLLKDNLSPFKRYFPGYETPGEIQEGFFAPGGEGYDPAQEDISSILARYPETGSIVDVAGTADDWYQEGAIPVYSGVPEWDDALDAALQTGKVPGEVGQTITTTARQDNTSIDPWLQPFLTDSSDTQVIDITGTLPRADVGEVPDRTPGSPTDTTPQPPTFDDDRTVGTTPATSGTGRTGGTGGTRSTTPATPPAQSGLDYQKLAYIFGLLGGQRPKEEEQYQAAQLQPFDRELMYGLRG